MYNVCWDFTDFLQNFPWPCPLQHLWPFSTICMNIHFKILEQCSVVYWQRPDSNPKDRVHLLSEHPSSRTIWQWRSGQVSQWFLSLLKTYLSHEPLQILFCFLFYILVLQLFIKIFCEFIWPYDLCISLDLSVRSLHFLPMSVQVLSRYFLPESDVHLGNANWSIKLISHRYEYECEWLFVSLCACGYWSLYFSLAMNWWLVLSVPCSSPMSAPALLEPHVGIKLRRIDKWVSQKNPKAHNSNCLWY